jgi:hypothetical protein
MSFNTRSRQDLTDQKLHALGAQIYSSTSRVRSSEQLLLTRTQIKV